MMFFFVIGLLFGFSLVAIPLIGKLYAYRKRLLINKEKISNLEQHSHQLQQQLLEMQRQQAPSAPPPQHNSPLREVA